jgi:hypothetical protein
VYGDMVFGEPAVFAAPAHSVGKREQYRCFLVATLNLGLLFVLLTHLFK